MRAREREGVGEGEGEVEGEGETSAKIWTKIHQLNARETLSVHLTVSLMAEDDMNLLDIISTSPMSVGQH